MRLFPILIQLAACNIFRVAENVMKNIDDLGLFISDRNVFELQEYDPDTGMALIHFMVLLESEGLVQGLLSKVPSCLEARTITQGYTPLHMAFSIQNLKIIELLLENGADANVRGYNSKSVMDLAPGCRECFRLFHKYSSRPTKRLY
jgi:hypothetical protein